MASALVMTGHVQEEVPEGHPHPHLLEGGGGERIGWRLHCCCAPTPTPPPITTRGRIDLRHTLCPPPPRLVWGAPCRRHAGAIQHTGVGARGGCRRVLGRGRHTVSSFRVRHGLRAQRCLHHAVWEALYCAHMHVLKCVCVCVCVCGCE